MKKTCVLVMVLVGMGQWVMPIMAAADGHITGTGRTWRAALIDRFHPGNEAFASERERELQEVLHGQLDFDGDWEKEPYYHGDIVEMLASHPRIVLRRYALPSDRKPMEGLLLRLKEINQGIDTHILDALVLPYESSTLISSLEKPLQKSHKKKYLQEIKRWGERDEVWALTYAIIEELSAISERGVKVFTIAGNGGTGMVNTYSFASNVITVGAKEPELAHFVANNVFVDRYERAAYMPKSLHASNGRMLGYDVTGNGCLDVPIERLTGYREGREDYPREAFRSLRGSSFAAPVAMVKSLVGQLSYRANYCNVMKVAFSR